MNCCWLYKQRTAKRHKIHVHGGWWLSATRGLLFIVCLFALSLSGQHERTAVCTLLLCAGPMEGCSAVFDTVDIGAWFVPSWCAQKKQG